MRWPLQGLHRPRNLDKTNGVVFFSDREEKHCAVWALRGKMVVRGQKNSMNQFSKSRLCFTTLCDWGQGNSKKKGKHAFDKQLFPLAGLDKITDFLERVLPLWLRSLHFAHKPQQWLGHYGVWRPVWGAAWHLLCGSARWAHPASEGWTPPVTGPHHPQSLSPVNHHSGRPEDEHQVSVLRVHIMCGSMIYVQTHQWWSPADSSSTQIEATGGQFSFCQVVKNFDWTWRADTHTDRVPLQCVCVRYVCSRGNVWLTVGRGRGHQVGFPRHVQALDRPGVEGKQALRIRSLHKQDTQQCHYTLIIYYSMW